MKGKWGKEFRGGTDEDELGLVWLRQFVNTIVDMFLFTTIV